MSTNLFAPPKAAQPKPVSVKPDLGVPPDGPPVPALVANSFWGSINQFAQRVQAVTDAHVQQFGYRPDPATVLKHAVDPTLPVEHLTNLFKPAPVQIETSPMLLRTIVGTAKSGGTPAYEAWMQDHGDQLTELAKTPGEKAKVSAAVAEARQWAEFTDKKNANDSLTDIAIVPVKTAVYSAKAVDALVRDLGAADRVSYGAKGREPSRAALANLEQTAPAVAQVVKGLAYSPIGGARIVDAALRDFGEADRIGYSGGSTKYNPRAQNTRAIGKETVEQILADLSHPNGRWGYLFLDAFAGLSLAMGAGVRAGRFAEARSGGATVGESAKAFTAPHPIQTFALSKDGFEAQIRLAQNPLMRMAQRPWLEWQQGRLNGEHVHTDLFGEPVDLSMGRDGWLGYPGRVGDWLARTNPLAGEAMIGRAENIRLQTEIRALGGMSTLLNDVAGSAARRTRWEKLIPDNIFKGLTVGEMKALELTSYDLSQGLSAVGVAERNAQWALENLPSERNHWLAQLGRTVEARKVFENPSPRFQAAIEAVRAATAQTEAIKADAGWLTDRTMENRVVKAGALVEHFPQLAPLISEHLAAQVAWQRASGIARKIPEDADLVAAAEQARAHLDANPHPFVDMEDGGVGMRVGGTVVPLNRNRPDSWYFPFAIKGKANKPATLTLARTGPSGFAPALLPPELRHEMTGAAYIHGDYRTDIHHLAGERLVRTAKAFVQWTQWKKAWDNAGDEFQPGFIAVRDTRNIPDELRRAWQQFEDEHLDVTTADALPDEIQRLLFPSDKEIQAGEHVRWIDPRLLGHAADRYRGDLLKPFEAVNNVLRPLIFYLYPKYALNGLGNAGMLALDQGVFRSANNLTRAMRIEEDSIGNDAALIKAQVGGGHAAAYALGTTGKVNRALAEFWNKLTDEKFRVAAFLHYADVKGYKTPELRHQLLTNKENMADLVDVTRRSNESLVAFDRMSPGERAWLRHLIFVYPWQRGAFLWSFRTLFEHPAKTALLATLGQDAYNDEKWLQEASAWVRRAGYLPLNWAASKAAGELPEGMRGKIHVWSPISINTFGTLNDVLQVISAETRGDKYASVGNLFGPPGQMAVHAALGVDDNGNRYTGSQLLASLKGALGTIPMVAAIERNHKKPDQPIPALDIKSRTSLIRRYHGYLMQAATSPGALDGFGRLIWGSDSELNLDAIAERYWKDATPQQRHQREAHLIQDWVSQQGVYLDRPVPTAVRQAITDAGQYAQRVTLFLTEHQKDHATDAEKLALRIDYYKQAGRITAAQATKLTKKYSQLEDKREIAHEDARLVAEYGHGKDLSEWVADVSKAAGVVENFDSRIAQLHELGLAEQRVYRTNGQTLDVGGLGALKVDKQKLAYARAYVAYVNDRKALQKELVGRKDQAIQLAIFDDEHDKPFGRFPSVARLAFSEGTSDVQRAAVAKLAGHAWKSLSGVEKAALGVKVDPKITLAWGNFQAATVELRKRDGSVTRAQKDALAKLVSKNTPGFMQDYIRATAPRVETYERTSLYRELPNRDWFDRNVGSQAKKIAAAIKTGADSTQAKQVWQQWVAEKVLPALKTDPALKNLRAVLKDYPQGFLEGLVTSGSA